MSYILTLLWMMFAAVLGKGAGMHRREKVLGREERRATWTYALLIVLPLIYFTATRSNYFYDTYGYMLDYQSIPSSMSGKMVYIRSHQKDTAFYALGALISVFAGKHFRYFFLAIAAFQGYCLAKTYRKYSEDFWLSMFLFVVTTDIYSWMYNGIRQFMAVVIIFVSSEWIFRRKYIRAVLAIVIASLFHQSALMMIPIVFFVQGKPWNWKMLLVLAGALVIMFNTGRFTVLLDSMLAETQYSNVVSDWTTWQDDGANPIRALVYSVPTILSLFCRKKIQKSGDRVVQVACNMGIVATALYMVSIVTSGIHMGRLPIYCSLYSNGILLPWELKHVYGKNMRMLALVCYLMFYYVQMHFVWGLL